VDIQNPGWLFGKHQADGIPAAAKEPGEAGKWDYEAINAFLASPRGYLKGTAMSYAGLRPQRVRRLVNLEGFGLPATEARDAPRRLVKWLDDLKTPQALYDYASVDEVAERLLKNNPLLTPDKAAWLAPHWSRQQADGRWRILGDPAHKRVNPVLYRVDEVLETWKAITAPMLWVEGDLTDVTKWWGHRYPKAEFHHRLTVVPQVRKVLLSPCGHMLHHDQPQALAAHVREFLA